MIDLNKASKAAEQAAYAADTHLWTTRSRLAEVFITQKEPGDVANAKDLTAKGLILDVVLKYFPERGFLGEEGDAVVHARDDNALLNSRSLMVGAPAWTAYFAASPGPQKRPQKRHPCKISSR